MNCESIKENHFQTDQRGIPLSRDAGAALTSSHFDIDAKRFSQVSNEGILMIYRKIDIRMWGDAKFCALSEKARYLWIYLLTGDHTTSLPGLVKVSGATL